MGKVPFRLILAGSGAAIDCMTTNDNEMVERRRVLFFCECVTVTCRYYHSREWLPMFRAVCFELRGSENWVGGLSGHR